MCVYSPMIVHVHGFVSLFVSRTIASAAMYFLYKRDASWQVQTTEQLLQKAILANLKTHVISFFGDTNYLHHA